MKYIRHSSFLLKNKLNLLLNNKKINNHHIKYYTNLILENDIVIVHPTRISRIQEPYDCKVIYDKNSYKYQLIQIGIFGVEAMEINDYMLSRIELKYREI